MVANSSKFQLVIFQCTKTLKRICLLLEKSLNHEIQLNYLELPETKILISKDIHKIFAAKQRIKPKLFYVSENF